MVLHKSSYIMICEWYKQYGHIIWFILYGPLDGAFRKFMTRKKRTKLEITWLMNWMILLPSRARNFNIRSWGRDMFIRKIHVSTLAMSQGIDKLNLMVDWFWVGINYHGSFLYQEFMDLLFPVRTSHYYSSWLKILKF